LRPFAGSVDFIEDPEPYVATRWREIREELGIPLALDRLEGVDAGGYDIRVLKPALETCERRAVPVVFTSYMDHPLGQMFAAWEASRYQGVQCEAGLLTHMLFEPDAFTEAVRSAGPQLLAPPGTGLGFDALLEALDWRILERGTRRPELFMNPRAPLADPPRELPDGCLVFPTSGSTGAPALVCLTPAAMTANAAAVNTRVGATPEDVWLRVLPEFHVGGMSIHYRAELSGSRVVVDEEKWDVRRFVRVVNAEGITLTSLVPSQVFDLVAAEEPSPPSLRAVFVGGGRLEASLYARGRALGWPLLPGFGMTEAASQVATARVESLHQPPVPGGPSLELLPCWEARVDETGRLQLRGAPLLSGRLVRQDGGDWKFQPALDEDGWFTTSDRVRLEGRFLIPLGRSDRVVKILGELVDLDALEAALLHAGLPPDRGSVVALPDERAGVRPWLITDFADAGPLVAAANAALPPFARIAGCRHGELPRSPLGKILRSRLAELPGA
jgi:O-succinylbenzoic acid--CoA ligase